VVSRGEDTRVVPWQAHRWPSLARPSARAARTWHGVTPRARCPTHDANITSLSRLWRLCLVRRTAPRNKIKNCLFSLGMVTVEELNGFLTFALDVRSQKLSNIGWSGWVTKYITYKYIKIAPFMDVVKWLTAISSEMICDRTAMGLPPVTSAILFVKLSYFGKTWLSRRSIWDVSASPSGIKLEWHVCKIYGKFLRDFSFFVVLTYLHTFVDVNFSHKKYQLMQYYSGAK
jgi:hypothetical protein